LVKGFFLVNVLKVACVAILFATAYAYPRDAFAEEGDFFRPYMGVTQGYDSNLRRFNSRETALAATGSSETSDTFTRKEVGVILDKQISLQKLYADISVNDTRYNRNSDIDNDGKKALGRWGWQVGNHLQGNVEASHEESLVPFADYRGLELNQRTIDRRLFDATWRFHPSWQVRSAISRSEMEFSAVSQQRANLNENAQELGVDYLSPSLSKIGIQYRHVRGDRPVPLQVGILLVDNSYDQNELKAKVDWMYSGKTQLQFLGGLVERKHDEFSERDYSGFNSRLNLNWAATGKTLVNISTWREIGGQSYVTSSYILSRGISLGLSWLVTGKVTVQGNLRYDNQDFQGDINSHRVDTYRSSSVSLLYKATDALSLNATLNRSTRISTNELLEFASSGAFLSAQYAF